MLATPQGWASCTPRALLLLQVGYLDVSVMFLCFFARFWQGGVQAGCLSDIHDAGFFRAKFFYFTYLIHSISQWHPC